MLALYLETKLVYGSEGLLQSRLVLTEQQE